MFFNYLNANVFEHNGSIAQTQRVSLKLTMETFASLFIKLNEDTKQSTWKNFSKKIHLGTSRCYYRSLNVLVTENKNDISNRLINQIFISFILRVSDGIRIDIRCVYN